ncbi:protein DEK [Aplochiton taeniatus]
MSETTKAMPENCPGIDGDKEEQKEGAVEKCSPTRHGRKVFAVGEVIEGKREKKNIQRLDYQISKPKEKLKIENGGGDKLGDIARTNHNITKMKPVDLKPLHLILFDRPGKVGTMRKDIRQFNGFPFEVDSDPYIKKREKMLRIATLTNSKLKTICKVLDLERSGTQPVIIDRILNYLVEPKNNGKPLILKKRKKSKKKLLGNDSKRKSKDKPKSTSVSPKKSKAQSKSKAIVTDSSSDDDNEEGQQEVTVELDWSESETKGGKTQKKEELSSEDTEDSEEVEDKSQKSNTAKEKAPAKKTPAIKRLQAAKKIVTPKRKVKEEASEPSDSDSDPEDSESEAEKVRVKPQPKKKAAVKRVAPTKPAAKTKKADSSSNRQKKNTAAGGSSDDDEPLIKMIKKTPAPSDAQLEETVQGLLREANLEEMTMKQICQKVYDTYPDHDLTSRKDYIKQTVKTLIL